MLSIVTYWKKVLDQVHEGTKQEKLTMLYAICTLKENLSCNQLSLLLGKHRSNVRKYLDYKDRKVDMKLLNEIYQSHKQCIT